MFDKVLNTHLQKNTFKILLSTRFDCNLNVFCNATLNMKNSDIPQTLSAS